MDGGGVTADVSSNVRIVGNSTFSDNSARNGGCIHVKFYRALWLHITIFSLEGNISFTNCSATDDSGAIEMG